MRTFKEANDYNKHEWTKSKYEPPTCDPNQHN